MMGFTHEELQRYFDPQLEESADYLEMTKTELLERIKSYYNGFSFDGRTLVYNPYSILMFFSKEEKEFDNFWFDTATPKLLADFMRGKHLTVEQFSGVTVPRSFAKTPDALDEAIPESFLYQTGYLSLRPAPGGGQGAVPDGPISHEPDVVPPVESDRVKDLKSTKGVKFYTLDYPNMEVRSSMSRLVVSGIMGDEVNALKIFFRTYNAFDNMNDELLVQEYNRLLARIPYEDYKAQLNDNIKNGDANILKNDSDPDPGESFFRSHLLSLIMGAGLSAQGESHGAVGKSDLVVSHKGRDWVIELKISKNTVVDDRAKAAEALRKILNKDYAGSFVNPILLGLAVNQPKRKVTTWVKRIGLNGDDVWTFPEPPKPVETPPRTPKP